MEPILDKEGIERSWAPLWRIYQQRWNENDSAVSLLWNFYWHERRGAAFAGELFPLYFYRAEGTATELSFLKGLVRYRATGSAKGLTFFWLPLGFHWGDDAAVATVAADNGERAAHGDH